MTFTKRLRSLEKAGKAFDAITVYLDRAKTIMTSREYEAYSEYLEELMVDDNAEPGDIAGRAIDKLLADEKCQNASKLMREFFWEREYAK